TEPVDDSIIIILLMYPGTDLASKMPFYEAEIMEIVINEKVNGIAYNISQKDFKVVYGIPGGEYKLIMPPVLIEIQQKVDMPFLKRLTRYCLNIRDLPKAEPVLMAIVIQGCSSEKKSLFSLEKIKRYAENGFEYTNKKIKIVKEDVTGIIAPIEKIITANSYFIIKLREEPGKFPWDECYRKGRPVYGHANVTLR
ncbi:hypothetical protein CU098_005279, partial [Rhizopus stolonifer]